MKKTKHVIMGSGNLGTALSKRLNTITYNRHNTTSIIEYANLFQSQGEEVTVWNTEGYGSVPECQKNPREAFEVHVMRNLDLMHGLNQEINLINFSTNYVDQEPKSEYAASKACMESLTKNFPRKKVISIRVANLYSKYFPLKSFQGKILKNADKINALPWNKMIPTDCDWLADKLCGIFFSDDKEINERRLNRYYNRVIQVAPNEMVDARKFGEMLLNKEITETVDESRPKFPTILNTWDFDDTWYKVWKNIEPEFMKNYEKAINNV